MKYNSLPAYLKDEGARIGRKYIPAVRAEIRKEREKVEKGIEGRLVGAIEGMVEGLGVGALGVEELDDSEGGGIFCEKECHSGIAAFFRMCNEVGSADEEVSGVEPGGQRTLDQLPSDRITSSTWPRKNLPP